tara:strand:- start:293 stop:820 length:528 start_codon:yes stop_codon:yes gene_type:complete
MTSQNQNQNQLKFTYAICDFDDKNEQMGSDSFDDLDECVEALKQNLLENPFKKTWKAEIWINGAEEIADRNKVVFEEADEFTAFEVDDEDYEWEYHNYGTEPEPRFGEISYQVAGGGMMNGNAYATIELKDGTYYYCEYGKNPSRVELIGNKIIWSPEIYDKKNPYECRSFDIGC